MENSDFSDKDVNVAQELLETSLLSVQVDDSSNKEIICLQFSNKTTLSKNAMFDSSDFILVSIAFYNKIDFQRRFIMPKFVFDRFFAGIYTEGLFSQRWCK